LIWQQKLEVRDACDFESDVGGSGICFGIGPGFGPAT
jgi:hypothetical protein